MQREKLNTLPLRKFLTLTARAKVSLGAKDTQNLTTLDRRRNRLKQVLMATVTAPKTTRKAKRRRSHPSLLSQAPQPTLIL
jgi:hypothetical protein